MPLAIIVPIITIAVAVACCTCCRSKVCPDSRVKVGPRRRRKVDQKETKEISVSASGPPTQSTGADTKTADSKSAATTAEKPPATTTRSVWTKEYDPQTGSEYYLNSVTNETQWDRPADFDPNT